MNAAFLLVTTAWIAGADTAAPTTPPAPAPAAAAPVHSIATGGYGGCGGCASCGCDSCCGESEGFFSKLKGRFHHSSECGCGCESEGFFSKLKGHLHHGGDCGCDTGCGGCGGCDTGCGHGGGFREKLRGLFHRGGDDCGCCDTACGGCTGCGGGVISPVPGGTMKAEPIPPPKETPKKLPSGEEKKGGSVQLIPQPIGTPVLQVAPTTTKNPF